MFETQPSWDDLLPMAAGVCGGLQSGTSTLDDAALVEQLRAAEELGRLADAARVTLAGEVADRSRRELGGDGLAARLGCRTPGELIERVTLVSGATARARMRAATPLRGGTALTGEPLPAPFPAVRSVFSDGVIGVDAASAITGALEGILHRAPGPETVAGVAAAEAVLVAAAVGEGREAPASADEIRIMAQTWALYLDPDGTLPDEQRGLRERGLTIGRLRNGVHPLGGGLLPEVAAQLQRLLDAYLNPRVGDGVHFEEVDADADDPVDPRTSAQKRHDALAGILSVAAGMDETPRLGGAAPVLVVNVTDTDLDSPAGVAFLQGFDEAAVPASVARHVGCAGAVQCVRTDGFGRIIELGSPQRTFTPQQRRAITFRDGECIIPGCHVPATWCEVHHVVPAAAGGPTHTDNGVLLCWHHHRTIETSGWEIRMVDGVPWVRAPRWLDPGQLWHPAAGSPARRLAVMRAGP